MKYPKSLPCLFGGVPAAMPGPGSKSGRAPFLTDYRLPIPGLTREPPAGLVRPGSRQEHGLLFHATCSARRHLRFVTTTPTQDSGRYSSLHSFYRAPAAWTGSVTCERSCQVQHPHPLHPHHPPRTHPPHTHSMQRDHQGSGLDGWQNACVPGARNMVSLTATASRLAGTPCLFACLFAWTYT